jgi:hypothetical protein
MMRTAVARGNAFILRAVPAVSPRTLAACRILFGALMLFLFAWRLSSDALVVLHKNGPAYALNSARWLATLSGDPLTRSVIRWAIVGGWLSFTLGFLTRITFPILVVSMWLYALLTNTGHYLTPLLLALSATVWARWSDALSIDRMIGLARPVANRSQLYGYPIWLLGLCITLAYFAAGLSKLVMTNGAWLWATGARWGFVSDLRFAATDLGVWIVNNYWLAVAASAFAAFGQIAYLWASFTRSATIKAMIGLGIALPFLVGLILFMGLFWWPWVLLVFLLYIPWPQLDRLFQRTSAERAFVDFRWHRRWAIGAAWVLLVSHLAIVAARTHAEPFLSNYDMYATVLPASTDHERQQWVTFKSHGIGHVEEIDIMTADGSFDSYSQPYRWGRALQQISLFPSDLYPVSLTKFHPGYIRHIARRGGTLDAVLCGKLQALADSLQADAKAIRFGLRNYDLVDGRLTWEEPTRDVIVQLQPGCPIVDAPTFVREASGSVRGGDGSSPVGSTQQH